MTALVVLCPMSATAGASAMNVILSTIKSILTVKGGKLSASFINALTYGFYSYVIVLTSADGMPIWLLPFVITLEKARKARLWKVELIH